MISHLTKTLFTNAASFRIFRFLPPPFFSGGNPDFKYTSIHPHFISLKKISAAACKRLFTPPNDLKQKLESNNFMAEEDRQLWMKHIRENDEQVHLLADLKEQLIGAVDRKDYEDVGRLRVAITAIAKNDTVGRVMSDLNKAIEEERYEDAAFLQDHANAGLVGWWFGNSGDDKDPYCPIIHVSAEHGRFLARSYSPWQLATAQNGTPFFEIYVRNNEKGEYKEQAFYLKQKAVPPEDEDSKGPFRGSCLDFQVRQLIPYEKAGYQWFETIKKMSTALGKDSGRLKDSSTEKYLDYGDEATKVATTALYFVFAVGGNGKKYTTTMNRDSVRVPAMLQKRGCLSFCLTTEDDKVQQDPDGDIRDGCHTLDHDILALVDSIGRGIFRKSGIPECCPFVCSRALNQRPILSGLTTFNRIDVTVSSDPFSGLYVGSNGYLVTEVIQVTCKFGQWCEDVAIEDLSTNESYYVEAVKLTGDPDVPAGEAIFKAKVGEEYKLPPGILEYNFGAVARYKGQGRLTGFQESKWVDAELLVLGGEHRENGFRIAFLYSAPEYYFLRFFKQLQLPSFQDPTDP